MTMIIPSRTLQTGLVADAIGSGALALLHLVAPGAVAGKVGASVALIAGTGLFMGAYAATLAWLATRPVLPRRAVQVIVWGNSAWVLGCLLLVALLPALNPWAIAHLALMAITVSGFVVLQARGLAQSGSALD